MRLFPGFSALEDRHSFSTYATCPYGEAKTQLCFVSAGPGSRGQVGAASKLARQVNCGMMEL